MNTASIIVLCIVFFSVAVSLYFYVKGRKKGGCCGNCGSCPGCGAYFDENRITK